MELIQFDKLLKDMQSRNSLEEKLSKTIRDITSEFSFQSLGLYLKVPKSDIYRLKISRNISHTFSKNTIFTKGDPMIEEIAKLETLNLLSPGRFIMEHDYENLVLLPIHHNEDLLGFFFIDNANNSFNSKEITQLNLYASVISFVVCTMQLEAQIDIRKKTHTEAVVLPYKSFMTKAKTIFSLMERYKRYITIAVARISNFEEVVRTIGENEMNDLMKQIANIFVSNFRDTDTIGKIHKDTFAILMPETSNKSSLIALERVKKKIDAIPISKIGKIGFGVANRSDQITNTKDLIKLAKEASDKAIHNGSSEVYVAN